MSYLAGVEVAGSIVGDGDVIIVRFNILQFSVTQSVSSRQRNPSK